MDFELCEIEPAKVSDFFLAEQCDEEAIRESVRASRAIAQRHRISARRALSELHLSELLPAEIAPGDSWHVMSRGDIDSLSYIAHIVEAEPLDYLLFSSWCMIGNDVERFARWVDEGKIGRLDAYVGEIFPNQYADAHAMLCDVVRRTAGRVCVFRNHSKIYAGQNARFAFAIESSANINTNPRAEQTAIHASGELFAFYKEYFDGIKSFNRDFDTWTPHETRPRP